MNARDFEKKLFALLFRSNQRLTPHFVAYQLDIPFEEAQRQLDQLAATGALRVEIDDEGGLWYEAPGVDRRHAATAPAPTPQEQPSAVRTVYSPARPSVNIFGIAAMLLGGFLLIKLFLPLLLLMGLFGVLRAGVAHRRRYSWFRRAQPRRLWLYRW